MYIIVYKWCHLLTHIRNCIHLSELSRVALIWIILVDLTTIDMVTYIWKFHNFKFYTLKTILTRRQTKLKWRDFSHSLRIQEWVQSCYIWISPLGLSYKSWHNLRIQVLLRETTSKSPTHPAFVALSFFLYSSYHHSPAYVEPLWCMKLYAGVLSRPHCQLVIRHFNFWGRVISCFKFGDCW